MTRKRTPSRHYSTIVVYRYTSRTVNSKLARSYTPYIYVYKYVYNEYSSCESYLRSFLRCWDYTKQISVNLYRFTALEKIGHTFVLHL